MLSPRVIPVLLLSGGDLVKTVRFKNASYVGDPLNAIRIFNEKEVDELIVVDIAASRQRREPNYELIADLASECFIPLTYGGGISCLDHARKLFSSGIEKICIQSSALMNLPFVTELATCFGSQSIVVSIDIKRAIFGKPRVFLSSLQESMKKSWLSVLSDVVAAGAGEILLNAVDKDGTLSHPDFDLIKQASASIDIPLIALGGISSLRDIQLAIKAGASAVAAGSFFVYHGPHRAVLITYPRPSELSQLFDS